MAAQAELDADSVEGRSRREKLKDALKAINREEHGLGIEMNQRYESKAVYQVGQGKIVPFLEDPLEYYCPTTYPGARLPHVWLGDHVPSKYISTVDLAGKGQFTLFTGIGGQGWKVAAEQLSTELGMLILLDMGKITKTCISIGRILEMCLSLAACLHGLTILWRGDVRLGRRRQRQN
jgi:hypothetical protein